MRKLSILLFFLITHINLSAQTQLDTATNFSVKDIHGNTIELFSVLDEGKLVVIDFFSTSCGPCALYAPDMQASYEDFGENTGNVFFMSIAWGDDNAGVAYFDSIHGLSFPSVSGSQGGGNQVHTQYMVVSTPTVILISPDREILEKYIWERTRANINAAIIAAGGSMVGLTDPRYSIIKEPRLYPNPSHGPVNVTLELEKTASCHVEIYRMAGTKVY